MFKTVDIKDLVPNPHAFRAVDKKSKAYHLLLKSIKEIGIKRRLIIVPNKKGEYIIADGMQRYHAAIDAGITKVRIKIV